MKNSKAYPWILVGLLWFVALLNYLDRQMLSTMQSSMQMDIKELAIAENFGRIMGGIFLLIYGLMSPVAGIIADRVNRKWLIVGSLFVWSAVTYGLGYAQTFQQVYWLRALMGVSEALTCHGIGDDCRFPLVEDKVAGNRHSHVGIICRAGARRIRCNHRGKLFMAHGFPLVRNCRDCICHAAYFLLHDKEGHAGTKTARLNVDPPQKASINKTSVLSSFGIILGTVSFWIMLFYFMAPSFPGWATKKLAPPHTVFRKPGN